MTDLAVILTPLLVLPIVLLFRFIGCDGEDRERNDQPVVNQVPPGPPSYHLYILQQDNVANYGVKNPGVVPIAADVIGYWRLVDGPGNTSAADEKKFQHGTFQTVASPIIEAPTNDDAGSQDGNPGGSGIVNLSSMGLIDSDPQKKGATFLGGYVAVAHQPGLYTDQFTIEAWYYPAWGINVTGYEHTLFSAGAPIAKQPSARSGFSLYVDRDNRWRVRLAPSGEITLDEAAPYVDAKNPRRAHIALTLQPDGSSKRVRLFVDGLDAGQAVVSNYTLPTDQLLIGIGDKQSDVAGVQAYRPFVGTIQEVVLHRKALKIEEIENHVDINRPRS